MKRYSKTFLASILTFIFLLGASFSSEAAINTDTAMTPAKGQLIIRSQVRAKRKSDDPSGMDRDMRVIANPNVFVYGLKDSTALFAVIPYLYKELRTDDASGNRVKRDESGLGDIGLFLKHRLWRRDAPGATTRFSVIGGLEFPTGEDEETDSLGKLPAVVQLGSGSWDPLVGFVITRQQHRFELSQDLVYKFNTEANDFEFGDELLHNTGFWFRIWPWELPDEGTPSSIHAVLEANGIWEQKNESAGTKDGNSGGYTLYLSPGIQYVTTRSILEFSVQLPVIQELNGTALEADWVIVGSVRLNF